MRNTQQMRDLWAPNGPTHNTLKFTFWNGVTVNGDKRMLLALDALDAILRKYGYAPKQDETWGYNNRPITGGSNYSLHAYGIAFDINSRANPYGKRLITNMDRRMIEEIEAIRTTRGVRVWRWGGDWNDNDVQDDSNYDAMHFESQASPAELAAGIAGTTTPQEEDDMYDVNYDRKVLEETNQIVKNLQAVAERDIDTLRPLIIEVLEAVKADDSSATGGAGAVDPDAFVDALANRLTNAA